MELGSASAEAMCNMQILRGDDRVLGSIVLDIITGRNKR